MNRYGDRAYRLLSQLSFPRVSGSDQEAKAAGIIADRIREIGFQPVLEPFEVQYRKPVRAELTLIEPVERSYTVTGFINAADTPEEGTVSEFYYLEQLSAASLKQAHGKFVLLNANPKLEEYKQLMAAGIQGYLVMNGTIRDTEDSIDLDTMRCKDYCAAFGLVPAFAIRMKDAVDLLRQNPKKVRFVLRSEEVTVTSHNIVVQIPGTEKAQEAIAVGAHYDSTEFSCGSWDNGAGAVQVVALLEHLAEHPPRRSIRAILFGSEEVGLKGSQAYLSQHPEEVEQLKTMVNLDLGGTVLGLNAVAVIGAPGLEHYIRGLVDEAGHQAIVIPHVMSSDSAVFSDYGIPTIGFCRMTPKGGGYMHTRYDNMDWISPDVLEEQIRILLFVMDRLTNAENFPIQKEISSEMQTKLIQYFGPGLSHTEQTQKAQGSAK